MKFDLILAIFYFLFLQTSGIESQAGIKCGNAVWFYRAGQEIPFRYGYDYCQDTCIQFKCIIENDVIIQGGKCYQEFENICKYVPTQLKEKIKMNMEYFQYADSSLIFASKNVDRGGEEEYKKLIELKPEAEKIFAAQIKTRWDGQEKVRHPDGYKDPRDNKFSVQCGVKLSCKPGTRVGIFDILEYTETKTCDACVSFMCTTNGKNIMVGSGCFEDFDSTCGNVAASDKDVISNNLQNSFHFGSNFVAASCSHEDHCSELELKRYTYINKEAFETFTKKVDKRYGRECVYHRLTTSIASFSSINVQLFGMLIFVFILIRLW